MGAVTWIKGKRLEPLADNWMAMVDADGVDREEDRTARQRSSFSR